MGWAEGRVLAGCRRATLAIGHKLSAAAVAFVSCLIAAANARADVPRPWQLDLQQPVTPVASELVWMHNGILLPIIIGIVILVLALLLYVMVRFRAAAHPVPTRTSHNTLIEILWTVLPVVILVFIAIPSFNLLYFQEKVPPSKLTLKVTGVQWYWHYTYPDNGNFGFDSNIVDEKDLKPDQKDKRLLEVDNEVVLPVGETVRVIIAGNDVMHSWFIPSLGVQKYAVPGHLNEVWVNIQKPGDYYGECNQICGVNHSFMPIKVHAVSPQEFQTWVNGAKTKFAREDGVPGQPATKVAAAGVKLASLH